MDLNYEEEELGQLKEGIYLVQCVDAEEKVSRKGNEMVEFTFRVIKDYETGDQSGQGEFLKYWLVKPQNRDHIKYFKRNIKQLRASAAIPDDEELDHNKLINKTLVVFAKKRNDGSEYADQLNIDKFLPKEDDKDEDAIFDDINKPLSDDDFEDDDENEDEIPF